MHYVVEKNGWSIYWDGRYITRQVGEQFGVPCQITRYYGGIENQIVHFGSRNVYLTEGVEGVHSSNRLVVTWFHGDESSPDPSMRSMIQRFLECIDSIDKVVTSSAIAQGRLSRWGVPQAKIALIPIGIDLNFFRPPTAIGRRKMRANLGIPEDAICIGSFQKDGKGWGEGLDPKLIKGPDVFLKVTESLAGRHPIFVLLLGPARGYVKRGLDELGVSYFHTFVKDYQDIVPYFHCLDMYLITSRDEGGPKAILECMATGVPVVTTRVGMAPDVIRQGENGFLADVEDVERLAALCDELIGDPSLRATMARNGQDIVADYDWSRIGAQYFERVYEPLLDR